MPELESRLSKIEQAILPPSEPVARNDDAQGPALPGLRRRSMISQHNASLTGRKHWTDERNILETAFRLESSVGTASAQGEQAHVTRLAELLVRT
jgi:hypothetical protein